MILCKGRRTLPSYLGSLAITGNKMHLKQTNRSKACRVLHVHMYIGASVGKKDPKNQLELNAFILSWTKSTF